MAHGGVIVPQPALRLNDLMQYIDVDEPGFWKASSGPAPDGWVDLNNRLPITNCVAEFLYYLRAKQIFGKALRDTYHAGFKYASVTKGFHQLEPMLSLIQCKSENVCHITLRLLKGPDAFAKDRRTVHLYVNNQGALCGATLWDEVRDQAIS